MGKKNKHKYDPASVYRRTVLNQEPEVTLGGSRSSYFDTDYISRYNSTEEVDLENRPESEDQSIEEINAQIRNLERTMHIKCNHRDKKGKLKLKSDGDLYECECGERFDLSIISEERIDAAVEVMHNMINALRMSDGVETLAKFDITDESIGLMNLDIKEIAKRYKKEFIK